MIGSLLYLAHAKLINNWMHFTNNLNFDHCLKKDTVRITRIGGYLNIFLKFLCPVVDQSVNSVSRKKHKPKNTDFHWWLVCEGIEDVTALWCARFLDLIRLPKSGNLIRPSTVGSKNILALEIIHAIKLILLITCIRW